MGSRMPLPKQKLACPVHSQLAIVVRRDTEKLYACVCLSGGALASDQCTGKQGEEIKRREVHTLQKSNALYLSSPGFERMTLSPLRSLKTMIVAGLVGLPYRFLSCRRNDVDCSQ